MKNTLEEKVNEIVNGLSGDIRIGQRYYVFTVTYAYIGVVSKVTDWAVHLEQVIGVMNAGGENDAVTQIINNKKKPEICETFGKPVIVAKQSITALIPF